MGCIGVAVQVNLSLSGIKRYHSSENVSTVFDNIEQ